MATNASYSSEEFSSDENFCDDSSDSGGDTSDGTVIYDVPVRFVSILEIFNFTGNYMNHRHVLVDVGPTLCRGCVGYLHVWNHTGTHVNKVVKTTKGIFIRVVSV